MEFMVWMAENPKVSGSNVAIKARELEGGLINHQEMVDPIQDMFVSFVAKKTTGHRIAEPCGECPLVSE